MLRLQRMPAWSLRSLRIVADHGHELALSGCGGGQSLAVTPPKAGSPLVGSRAMLVGCSML